MRRFLGRAGLFLIGLVVLAYLLWRSQCQQAPPPVMVVEERLVGTWEGDLGPLYLEVYPELEAAELEAMLSGVRLLETFRSDGSRVQEQSAGDESLVARGTWESLSSEGDVHRVRLTLEEGASAYDEGRLTFLDDETFELFYDNGGGQLEGKNVTFHRVGAAEPVNSASED